MPRPGPVPITAPTDAGQRPARGEQRLEQRQPRHGPSSANPIGSVDQAMVWLSANTRPWNRCGTFTWTIVA